MLPVALLGLSVAFQVPKGIPDRVEPLRPNAVRLGGLLGERYYGSIYNRLMQYDEHVLLDGYRSRPGSHPWIGEHVGKWLHAASLSYIATGDARLGEKLKRVANGLMDTQEADGYLGTYDKQHRFGIFPGADWDVWSHKYCIIGLLAYYDATRDPRAIAVSRKAADLLIRTFPPGGRSIVEAGTHLGMAATSVLEPIVQLYRVTKDPRYLKFAERIVASYKDKNGPHVVQDLMKTGSVAKTANGKAYEMLSNLVGLSEMYRATGDPYYLKPVNIAWNDIVKNRLYITGTGSSFEHWTANGNMPNGEADNVGETCVTVTWLQLNLQLLRLTGESRYADQLEKTIYNHLLGAQKPDGSGWSYYTPLEGHKVQTSGTSCCISSGPRGIALMPTFAYARRKDGIDVNLYGPSVLTLPGLRLRQVGDYPMSSTCRLFVEATPTGPWTLRLRIPSWVSRPKLALNGRALVSPKPGEYVSIQRAWQVGDRIDLELPMPNAWVKGTGNNAGRVALMRGPVVFAIDTLYNPNYKPTKYAGMLDMKSLVETDLPTKPERIHLTAKAFALSPRTGARRPEKAVFVPYFAAGASGSSISVWPLLPTTKLTPKPVPSLLGYSEESQSRSGNQSGSMVDGDPKTRTVTYDGEKADVDWFAVELSDAETIGRVVFRHGAAYHDGGWFDTSAGKPRIQVQRTRGGAWTDVATLDSYPETDAHTMPDLREGQAFEVKFAPITVYGVRVVGKPSCGDDTRQSFSSCAELEAYAH